MQRTPVRAALAAVLLGVLMTLPLAAHAATASLSATFEITPSAVSISGTLTVDGRGLGREALVATLNGSPRAETTTRGNGAFTMDFRLPRDLSAGTHEVAVVFQGSDAASGTRATATFTISSTPDPGESDDTRDPGNGDTAEPTTQAPAATTLTASGPADAVNGSLVTLDGRLETGSGAIGNAGVSVSDAGGEVDDSFTVTASDGTFTTYYSVPESQPDGTLTLTLSFAGTPSLAGASTQVSISIRHTVVASPEPSESSDPSPSPSASQDATASPTSSATATPATTEAVGGSSLNGFFIAVVSVGAMGIITASVLVYRGVHATGHHDEERSLDMFDDSEPPQAPRRG